MNLHDEIQLVAAYLQARFKFLQKNDEGASAVEYGLVVSLIAVAIVLAVKTLGGKISAMFTSISSNF